MPPEGRHAWMHRGARRACQRRLCRSRALVLLAIGALYGPAAGLGAARPEGDAGTELRAGAPIERELASGESHRYRLEVPATGSLLVTVEQRGIDLAVAVARPDGRELPPVDSPNDREGL